MPPNERKLSVANIIAEAFWLPWTRRSAFLKGLVVPAIAIVAVQVGLSHAEVSTGPAAWMMFVVNVLLWILFAVACHRLVLLGLDTRDVPLVPGWGPRETRFLGCILLITAVSWGAVLAAVMTIGLVVVNLTSPAAFEAIQPYITGLIGLFFFARMGPVLPAAAIGAPIDFRDMWQRTRGNTWRLMLIVGAFPWIFAWVSYYAGGSDPGPLREIAAVVLGTLFLVIEVAALSISYRRLNENAGS